MKKQIVKWFIVSVSIFLLAGCANKEIENKKNNNGIFVEQSVNVINKKVQNDILEIANELKNKFNINLYVAASKDIGIPNSLSDIQRLDALKKYSNNLQSNINTSEKYVLFILATEQTYLNIFNTDNLISKDEKIEIIDSYMIPILASKENLKLEIKISASTLNGIIGLAEILGKNNNIEISSIKKFTNK